MKRKIITTILGGAITVAVSKMPHKEKHIEFHDKVYEVSAISSMNFSIQEEIKTEPEVIPEPVIIPEPVVIEVENVQEIKPTYSDDPNNIDTYEKVWFGNRTGKQHLEQCMSDSTVAEKFVKPFREKYGYEISILACVTLNYENGRYDWNAQAPCWSTNTQQATTTTCQYASDNSAGIDTGLFMINTYFQANRITKLGGQDLACNFGDNRSAGDECNKKKMTWLKNPENQVKIIFDIFDEQGFTPWVAYKKHVMGQAKKYNYLVESYKHLL